MSVQVRLRFTKSLLQRSERLCFMLGFVSLGFCAAVLAHIWFFQTYENWAFEQELSGEPASITEFLAQTVSFSNAVPEPLAISPASGGGRPHTLGFQGAGGGSIVGRLEIPRLGLRAMVLEGVTPRTLALALGHIPGTALPGTAGNVGIAGHRDTLFRVLRGVRAGDAIVLTTLEGSYEYRVKSYEVVGPRETRVLNDSPQPSLTLVTCYPFYYIGPAPERFIVHASRAAL
jgi:sortase A